MGKTYRLKRSSSFKTITLIIIGVILAFTFFRENIMVGLINPLRGVFMKIFSFFPVIAIILGFVYLLGGLVSKKGRAGKIMLGIFCLIFGLYLINPNGIGDLFSNIIFGRDSPRGWR